MIMAFILQKLSLGVEGLNIIIHLIFKNIFW